MSTRQTREIFLKVRSVAAQFAERCDFITAGRIKSAEASCTSANAFVCVEYRDGVERAQIIASIVYGAELHSLNFSCVREEDITVDIKTKMVTIVLSMPEGK